MVHSPTDAEQQKNASNRANMAGRCSAQDGRRLTQKLKVSRALEKVAVKWVRRVSSLLQQNLHQQNGHLNILE
ncbi:putative aryl-alcohol dehydrogenase [Moniliophthora roreri]|nr:putative aryl-alcohol dehydrogenase [Moniliophthora roreri]